MAVTTSWTKQTIAPSSSWTEDLDVVSTTWSEQVISPISTWTEDLDVVATTWSEQVIAPSTSWTETLEQFKFWVDGNIFWQNVTNNYEDL